MSANCEAAGRESAVLAEFYAGSCTGLISAPVTFSDERKKNEVFADFSHLRNKELECFILVVWLMAKYAVLAFLFPKGGVSLLGETWRHCFNHTSTFL